MNIINEILATFGGIQNVNYIEYIFQIIQLIMTIITFLTVFMSVHYQENVIKLQRAKMDIKLQENITDVKKELYEYIYMKNYSIKHYKGTLKIFDIFSMLILCISMICAFIYSMYLSMMSILLIWSTELIFLLSIYFISRKLHGNVKESDINCFFDYMQKEKFYNEKLDLIPIIKIIVPKNECKYIVEIIIPYYFYNFECVLSMNNATKFIEILAKGGEKKEVIEQDMLNDYVISNTFDEEFKCIDREISIFTRSEKRFNAYKANIFKKEEEYCTVFEIKAEKLMKYNQLSPITISNLEKIENNTISIFS